MEENFDIYKTEDINESPNEKNNIYNANNIYNSNNNLMNQNNFNYKDYKKEIDSDYSSLLNKYKILNMDNFKNKNITNDNDMDNENVNINIRDKIINKSQNNVLTDQEMTKLNNNYTKQINEIISKNFKNGLDMSQNVYNNNSYLYSNQNNSNYLELDRERKLLLLKNIELEKEINNLNNFVDLGNKYTNNINRSTNISNINKSNKNVSYNNITKTENSVHKRNLSSKNNINKYKRNSSFSHKNINKSKRNVNRDYKAEIIEAQNTIQDLDGRISQLKQEINNNYSMNNRCSDKIKEIKIWRETFYEEYDKYKNLLKDLKENLNNDKILYNDVIWKMKQKAADNINTIYENYKSQIAENDQKLAFLRKENEKLVSKENKVKEIYLYNFK